MSNIRKELLSYISDAHKDAYGRRPDMRFYVDMNIADLRLEADMLSDAVVREIERERAAEKRALASFESEVTSAIEYGAETRADAIRWVLDAHNLNNEYDAGYICFHFGLNYSLSDMFKDFVSFDHDPRNVS